jgi:hypothetical protein
LYHAHDWPKLLLVTVPRIDGFACVAEDEDVLALAEVEWWGLGWWG